MSGIPENAEYDVLEYRHRNEIEVRLKHGTKSRCKYYLWSEGVFKTLKVARLAGLICMFLIETWSHRSMAILLVLT